MNKLLFTIYILFATSAIFAQTWDFGTGAWISPFSKNLGVQKNFQVGDNVGNDTLVVKGNAYIITAGSESQFTDALISSSISTATDTSLYTQNDTLIETIVIRPTGDISSIHHSGDHMELNVRDGTDSTSSILHIHGNEGFIFEKDLLTGTDSIIFQIKTDTRQIQYYKDPCAGCILADDGAGLGIIEYVTEASISPWTSDATRIWQRDTTDFVGIGTTTPSSILEVVSSDTTNFTIGPNLTSNCESFEVNAFSAINLTTATDIVCAATGNIQLNANDSVVVTAEITPNVSSVYNIGTPQFFFDSLFINTISYQDTVAPGAETATLTNSPVAGDPIGYIEIVIAGVKRIIPYWDKP